VLIEPVTATYPGVADRMWTTEYDSAGLAVRTVEPGGVTVDRAFDTWGRVTSEIGSSAGVVTATTTFVYDAAGNRTQTGSPAGTIGFVYDDRGLLPQTTGPIQYQS
jgi:YD repeat-containing protein